MALYDPRTERYLTLNPTATRIWELMSDGNQPAAIVDRISSEYCAPRDQVTADVSTQIASFLSDGLIEPATPGHEPQRHMGGMAQEVGTEASVSGTPEPGSVEVKVPSFLRCLMEIIRIKWLLLSRGFEGTIAWIREQFEQTPASEAAEVDDARALEYAMAMAGAFYPGRAKCLEQSLALYVLARSQGVAARYCQGVQLYPFEAHAWIEYRGQAINDLPEHTKYFTRFPDQLP